MEFNPFSADFFDDPYETYGWLRDHAPVYHNDQYGFWALSRYDEVVAADRSADRPRRDPGRSAQEDPRRSRRSRRGASSASPATHEHLHDALLGATPPVHADDQVLEPLDLTLERERGVLVLVLRFRAIGLHRPELVRLVRSAYLP